jgi:hypothetical protein
MEAPKIKMPTVSAKIHKKLDLFADDKIVQKWSATYIVSSLFYSYLFNKYKHNCINLQFNKQPGIMMSLYYSEDTFRPGNSLIKIFRCIDKNKSDVVVIPLTLKSPNSYHANLLIYRKKYNTIEHFEPHGSSYGARGENEKSRIINANLDIIIENLNKTRGSDIKLVRSDVVCPRMQGLQGLEGSSKILKLDKEGGGYCGAWSMFFTELVLKNPTIPSSELMQIIFDKIDSKVVATDYLRKIIIGYVNVIHDNIKKYYSFISGIKNITVDEIMEIDDKTSPFMTDYVSIVNVQTFILNKPSADKEEYLKHLKALPPYPEALGTIRLLESMDRLLNPSITKSESTHVKTPTPPVKSPIAPPPAKSPTPAKSPIAPPPVKPPTPAKSPIAPPRVNTPTPVKTKRCPKGSHRDPKTKNCVKNGDAKIVEEKRSPSGTRKRNLLNSTITK